MVMAIMGTAAAIAMPRFAEAEARWRVQGAADRLAADLERARATALATSAEVTVAFAETRYEMTGSSDLNAAEELGTVLLGEPPYGVEIVSADFGGEQTLRFTGSGIGSADGTIVLGRGEFRVAIKFNALTGRAKAGVIYEDNRLTVTKVEAIGGAKILGGTK